MRSVKRIGSKCSTVCSGFRRHLLPYVSAISRNSQTTITAVESSWQPENQETAVWPLISDREGRESQR
ncbi:hypothetical protein RJT34_03620 [Clitoria ternatea]|uniref:Uncharacterized protein n=1 Tax=Clitoria ternatea TaxID=43366 RepID=A0AAN9KK48_CLITE